MKVVILRVINIKPEGPNRIGGEMIGKGGAMVIRGQFAYIIFILEIGSVSTQKVGLQLAWQLFLPCHKEGRAQL